METVSKRTSLYVQQRCGKKVFQAVVCIVCRAYQNARYNNKNLKNPALFGTCHLFSASKCRKQADFDISEVKFNARPAQAVFCLSITGLNATGCEYPKSRDFSLRAINSGARQETLGMIN